MNIRDTIKTLEIREHLKYRLEAWLVLYEDYYRSESKHITSATALSALGDCYPEELQHTEKYLKHVLGTN